MVPVFVIFNYFLMLRLGFGFIFAVFFTLTSALKNGGNSFLEEKQSEFVYNIRPFILLTAYNL